MRVCTYRQKGCRDTRIYNIMEYRGQECPLWYPWCNSGLLGQSISNFHLEWSIPYKAGNRWSNILVGNERRMLMYWFQTPELDESFKDMQHLHVADVIAIEILNNPRCQSERFLLCEKLGAKVEFLGLCHNRNVSSLYFRNLANYIYALKFLESSFYYVFKMFFYIISC